MSKAKPQSPEAAAWQETVRRDDEIKAAPVHAVEPAPFAVGDRVTLGDGGCYMYVVSVAKGRVVTNWHDKNLVVQEKEFPAGALRKS